MIRRSCRHARQHALQDRDGPDPGRLAMSSGASMRRPRADDEQLSCEAAGRGADGEGGVSAVWGSPNSATAARARRVRAQALVEITAVGVIQPTGQLSPSVRTAALEIAASVLLDQGGSGHSRSSSAALIAAAKSRQSARRRRSMHPGIGQHGRSAAGDRRRRTRIALIRPCGASRRSAGRGWFLRADPAPARWRPASDSITACAVPRARLKAPPSSNAPG